MSYKLFAQRVGLVGITNVFIGLKGMILLPVLTKSLGSEQFGIWSQILVTLYLLAPLAVLQLDVAFTRFIAGEKNTEKIRKDFYSILSIVAASGVLLAAITFILASPVAAIFFDGSKSVPYIKLLSVIIFLTALDTICIQSFKAFLQMKKYSGFIILQELLEIVLISYAVLSGYSLFGALVSLIIIKTFLLFLSFFSIYSQIRVSFPELSVIKSYLNFSLPLVPGFLSGWIVTVSDRYMIAYFIGISSVGIYSAAYNIGNLVAVFMGPIDTTLFPTISNLYRNNNIEELRKYLNYSVKFYLMLAVPSLFGLAVLSKSLLITLTTSEFLEAYFIVPIVALGTIAYAAGGIFSYILILSKKTKIAGMISGISSLINIALNIIFIPIMGIMGAAISTLITFFFVAFIYGILGFREISFDIGSRFISKSVIASIPMAFVVWMLNPYGVIDILISIVIAGLIYFGFLILLKGFTKEEYMFFRGILEW